MLKLVFIICLIYGSNADSWSVPEKKQYLLTCFLKSPFQWSRMFPACGVMWLQAVPLLTLALKCFGFLQRKVSWEYKVWKLNLCRPIYGSKTDDECVSLPVWATQRDLSPTPIQHDHTKLCPYHTCTPHIAVPLLQCEMSWVWST